MRRYMADFDKAWEEMMGAQGAGSSGLSPEGIERKGGKAFLWVLVVTQPVAGGCHHFHVFSVTILQVSLACIMIRTLALHELAPSLIRTASALVLPCVLLVGWRRLPERTSPQHPEAPWWPGRPTERPPSARLEPATWSTWLRRAARPRSCGTRIRCGKVYGVCGDKAATRGWCFTHRL